VWGQPQGMCAGEAEDMETQGEAFGGKSVEEITRMLLSGGFILADAKGIDEDALETLYVLGMNLYKGGRYEDAAKVFRFLAFFNHMDKRYAFAAGASLQMLGRLDDALTAYSLAGMLDVSDPAAPLHAGECLLSLGRPVEARAALDAAILAAQCKEEYGAVLDRAERLRKRTAEGAT